MRLPEKPIDWVKVADQEGEKVFNLGRIPQISEFNRKYLYWSELKYRIKDEKDVKYVWAFMKLLRSEKYEEIFFDSINLKYNLLSEFSMKLHQFDKFLAGNVEIQTKTLGLEKRYIISSLMEEAIASSIIEGAATTRKVAKEMLRQKRKPKNKSEKMILNNYETMRLVASKRNERLTPQLLLEIQKNVTKGTLEKEEYEGKFRDSDDIVVGGDDLADIAHVPPKCKEIPKLIEELCRFANEDSEDNFIHPILKGTILHFLIGYIHPFNDGNGRTARSVFYWYVLSKGYWLFEYMAVSRRIVRSRKEYDLAYLYTEYDEMDLTYFIKYIVTCIDDSLVDMLNYIKNKQKEQADIKNFLGKLKDLNFRQATILEEFMRSPNKIFTIKEIAETYKVVYQTARTDLLHLADRGYVNVRRSGRTFVFVFNEKIRDKLSQL